MSTITKIGIKKPLIFIILKNNTIPTFDITTEEDYSLKSLRFEMKENKESGYPVLLRKENTLAGGDDTQMFITATNINLGINSVDTGILEFTGKRKRYIFEIKNIDDDVSIFWGYILVIKTLQDGTDGYTPPVLGRTVVDLIFKVLDAAENSVNLTVGITKEQDKIGVVLTGEYDGAGNYEITSDKAIFLESYQVDVKNILRDDDDYFFPRGYYISDYKLGIKITPWEAGGLADHDIRVILQRIV